MLGQTTQTWADAATLWASIEPLAGRELERARSVVSTATHRFNLRFRDNVTTRDRFTFDSRTFNIENVQDMDERGIQLTLLCVEQS